MANDNAMGDSKRADKNRRIFRLSMSVLWPDLLKKPKAKLRIHTLQLAMYILSIAPFGNFIGPESQAAAEAAYCAGDQNKYWEYHDILFANQTGENVGAYYRPSAWVLLPKRLSLDMDAFKDCFEERSYQLVPNKTIQDGSAAGVTGTPAFFITYTR